MSNEHLFPFESRVFLILNYIAGFSQIFNTNLRVRRKSFLTTYCKYRIDILTFRDGYKISIKCAQQNQDETNLLLLTYQEYVNVKQVICGDLIETSAADTRL